MNGTICQTGSGGGQTAIQAGLPQRRVSASVIFRQRGQGDFATEPSGSRIASSSQLKLHFSQK